MTELEKIIYEKMALQYIAFPARVEKQHGIFVDVVPLYETWQGEDYSVIENCPVLNQAGGHSYTYQKGDIVVCLTPKGVVTQLFNEKEREDNITPTHQMNEAFIIGGFSSERREEGHVLKYGNNSIQITNDKIIIKGNVEIQNSGNIELKGGDIKFSDVLAFRTHVHVTPSGTSDAPTNV